MTGFIFCRMTITFNQCLILELLFSLSTFQEVTPVELPSLGLNKVDPILGGFKPSAPAHSGKEAVTHGSHPVKPVLGTSMCSYSNTAVTIPTDNADEELDLLLGLQKPVTRLSLAESEPSDPLEEVIAVSEKGEFLF